MRVALALMALAACGDSYLVVFVEGADPELTVSPVEVRVGVYGNRERVDFEYTTRLETKEANGVPATDFALQLGEAAQLRIAVPTTTTTWFADAKVSGDGEMHLPLFAGERAVTTATFGNGDLDTSVLFGGGIAMGWIDAGGVEVRVERDPDRLIARSVVVAPDPLAKTVRLASRPNPLGYGPDLYSIGWIGGDGKVRARVTTIALEFPVRELGVSAEDLAIGAAFKGAPFAIAVGTRSGGTMRLQIIDETGLPAAGPLGQPVEIASGVSTIVGIVVTREGITVGWRGNTGSRLTLVNNDGTVRTEKPVAGDLVGVALTGDGSRVLTLERRALQLFQVSYFPTLAVTGVEAELGTTTIGRASISACVASWAEVRPDGSNVTDLRFAVLDSDGRIAGEPHLLNVEQAGDHVSPTSVCASQTRAYTTFFERAGATDSTARLRIRRIPTY